MFTQQNKFKLLLNPDTPASEKETANKETVLSSKISGINFLESTTPALQVPIENKNTSDNNLDNTGITVSENKLCYTLFDF